MNIEEFKNVAVLQAMDSSTLARLSEVLEDAHYADGQTVFAEGDPGDSMFFIVGGSVRIEKCSGTTHSDRKTLAVLEAGDYFGEMALLDQKPRSASAVAMGDTRILRLGKSAFDQMQIPGSAAGLGVLFAMIRTSSERIRRLSAQLVVYDEVGKTIGEARNLQTMLDVILNQLTAATMADWGILLLHSPFAAALELRSIVNLILTEKQRAAIIAGQGCVGLVMHDLQARLVNDLDADEAFKACARIGFETPSLILSPMTLEGRLLGLIILGGKGRHQFDRNALNLTRGVTRQAAQAITNTRHREDELARSRYSGQPLRS